MNIRKKSNINHLGFFQDGGQRNGLWDRGDQHERQRTPGNALHKPLVAEQVVLTYFDSFSFNINILSSGFSYDAFKFIELTEQNAQQILGLALVGRIKFSVCQ